MTDEAAKHTPGPWIVDEDDPHCIYAPDGDAEPWFVAEAAYDCGPGNSGIANAAHIVKCVNAHDELVKAAQAGAELVEKISEMIAKASHEAFDGDNAPLVEFANEIDHWMSNGVLASYRDDFAAALQKAGG